MEAKENLKLGLLGIIAVTLIINTFFMGDGVSVTKSPTASAPVDQSNKIAPQIAPTPSPIANPVQVPAGPTTTIAYSEEVHNFGNIKQDTENEAWKDIKYMVFDAPLVKGGFSHRLKVLEAKLKEK